MKKLMIGVIAILTAATGMAPAQAQVSYDTELRTAFEGMLWRLSRNDWILTYQAGSMGYPEFTEIADNGQRGVIRVAYRYTNGQSDVIYYAYNSIGQTCIAYEYDNEYCTLTGKYRGDGPSRQQNQLTGWIALELARAAMAPNN